MRGRLRQGRIEREARRSLAPDEAVRLERRGLLAPVDERAAWAELRELEADLAALERLQAWVEQRLAEVSAA